MAEYEDWNVNRKAPNPYVEPVASKSLLYDAQINCEPLS
jgi:hypothetical protein